MKDRSFLPLLALLLLALSGCAHTILSPLPPAPENLQLIEGNRKTIALSVEDASTAGKIHGWQFMLFVLPLGRVTVEKPLYHLQAALINQFGLAGLKIKPEKSADADLIITLEELSVTAYDLLFTRRIVARVKLQCERQMSQQSLIFSIEQEHTEYARYAFQKELTASLERAFDRAANSIVIQCLEHR